MYEFTVLNDIFNFWRYKMTTDEKALELHEKWNGKIATEAKCHVKTREDLSLAYTPGVAKPCMEIAKNPDDAVSYTHLFNIPLLLSLVLILN